MNNTITYREVNSNGDPISAERLERGEILQAGYVTYNNRALTAAQCESVNTLTRRIIASAQATGTVSSDLLNMRHRELLGAATGWQY